MSKVNPNALTVSIETPMPPPEWAVLERELIRAQTRGVRSVLQPVL